MLVLLQPLEAHSCCHFLWTHLSCPLKELIWEEPGIVHLGYLLWFCSVHSTHPTSFHCNKRETQPLLQHVSIKIQCEVHELDLSERSADASESACIAKY